MFMYCFVKKRKSVDYRQSSQVHLGHVILLRRYCIHNIDSPYSLISIKQTMNWKSSHVCLSSPPVVIDFVPRDQSRYFISPKLAFALCPYGSSCQNRSISGYNLYNPSILPVHYSKISWSMSILWELSTLDPLGTILALAYGSSSNASNPVSCPLSIWKPLPLVVVYHW